jgi:hypothetical protein
MISRLSRLHLQSLAPTNPHWARVVGYGSFSLCVIHKEGLCPSSGDINRLMISANIKLQVYSVMCCCPYQVNCTKFDISIQSSENGIRRSTPWNSNINLRYDGSGTPKLQGGLITMNLRHLYIIIINILYKGLNFNLEIGCNILPEYSNYF